MKINVIKQNKYYEIIMLAGLICCILWAALVNTKPFSDFNYYYELAAEIANGKQWGDTYTSVGYPIVLGQIFKVFGVSILNAKIFNIILTLISNLFFLIILKRIPLKEIERKIIFALFVFMPNNIFYNSILGTEILFTTILLGITCLYFSKLRLKYVLIGILTGLNTMIKPFFIVFFLAIFLVDLIIQKKLLKPLLNSAVVLILSFLILTPWLYRNTKLIGQFTYVSNNGGIVLYINNNSQNKNGRWMAAEDVENSVVKTQEYKNANMTQKNKMLSSAAKKWIKSHPKQFMELGFKRLFNTYFVGDDIVYSTYGANLSHCSKAVLYLITGIIRSVVFAFGIVYILLYGIYVLLNIFNFKSGDINKFDLYCVILFCMFTSVYFITEGQGRYSFPEIFIFVYGFYHFIKLTICKYKELNL
ncbi:hypothetical protein [Clostridium sp. JN-1]|uniref:ArnT family glycosyltransferase n=1 Tax=Clostridium sp. JN-1 TaxID=2483110 RepID=UPI000F0AF6D1|nr:hypothetical protein [Clostridium sp. JN-1]